MRAFFLLGAVILAACAPNPYVQERSFVTTFAAPGTPIHWGWTCPAELVEPGTAVIASACARWPIPGTSIRVVRYPAVLPPGVEGIGPAGPTGSRLATSYRLPASASHRDRFRVELGLERPGPVHAEIVLSWLRREGALYVGDAPWEVYHLARGLGDEAPMPTALQSAGNK